MKKTAKFYAENEESRKKRLAYQKEYNKKPEQRKKRAELVQARRDRGIYGKGGDDLAHTKNGLVRKNPSKNRGSRSDMPGDKRARGGKKK
jgi:hypothetical protein